jgi:predicted Zn-dependent protease
MTGTYGASMRAVARPHPGWWVTAACWLTVAVTLSIGCGGAPTSWPAPQQAPGPQGEGPGGREQPLALSPKQELAIGRRAAQDVVNEYGDRMLPASNPKVVRVRGITDKIVKAAQIEALQREINLRLRGYLFEWDANVINDPKINAFCLPGGKVFVFTGILPVVGGDDDQLATVLSHEIAHALAHHASERLAREQGGQNPFEKLRFNRAQESEADHIGLFLMTFAGYDPHKAVTFWERMRRATANQQRPPEILSDHPSDEHRIEAMKQWVPKALAGKQAYDEGRIAR